MLNYNSTPAYNSLDETAFEIAFANRKCKFLKDDNFTRCFFEQKGFLPHCYSRYCPKCHFMRRNGQKDDVLALVSGFPLYYIRCHTYQLTLPYFGLMRKSRTKCDEAFKRWWRRNISDFTYLRSVELQGILHINYLMFSLSSTNPRTVCDKWYSLVNQHQDRQRIPNYEECQECKDINEWTQYVVKPYSQMPETFVPPNWICRVPVRKANNWKKFWQNLKLEGH